MHFAADGHTLAVGSSMNGQNQQCLVYDLRKSSSITLGLHGHEAAIQCIRFTNKFDKDKDRGDVNFVNTSNAVPSNSGAQMKSIEQIREEAKQNIEKRMKQQEIESKMNTIESKA